MSRIQRIEMIDDAMVEVLRQKTDAERFAMIDQMWRFARDLIRNNLRRDHPEWSEDQIQRETARRLSHGAV
jgi:hypothetical protein